MAKYNHAIQIIGLREIEKNNIIKNFSFERRYNSSYTFHFSLTEISMNYEEYQLERNFSSYRIRIECSNIESPKVFIDNPTIWINTPHINGDRSLCLFKVTNFQWFDSNSIAKDIVPLIYMWVYFYEKWQITGVWLGKEAIH